MTNHLKGPDDIPFNHVRLGETKKAAHLDGLEIEARRMQEKENIVPPDGSGIQSVKQEKIEIFETPKSHLPKAGALMRKLINEEGICQKQAIVMADALDQQVDSIYFREVQYAVEEALSRAPSELSPQDKAVIAQQTEDKVRQKFLNAINFFVTPDPRKGQETPLERMSAPFAYLNEPEDTVGKELFNQGMHEYSSELIKRAFDQHLENPEQYVSHGFDHSINVANYTRDVIRLNPEIAAATSSKYGISEGEAKFMLETVALLHDCGYPTVGDRGKSVHGISGADLVLFMAPMFDKIITSPHAQKEILFNDFRNSILFHSADKIEQAFTTKIISTLGTFLADHTNIVQILSNFYDPKKNPSGQPRFVTEIYTQSPEMRKVIEENLALARKDLEKKLGRSAELPKVTIHGSLFKGRYADLEYNKDKLLGLEFSMTDLLTSPLTMIRLVDNMDMSKTRLSPTQNEEAFHMIYYKLGDNREISRLAMALEKLERKVDALIKDTLPTDKPALNVHIAQVTQQKMLEQIKLNLIPAASNDPFIANLVSKLTIEQIERVKNPKDARQLLTRSLILTVFEEKKFSSLSIETKDKIMKIGMQQSSIDLRHFGGCESVKNVQLVGTTTETGRNLPSVIVTVDRAAFEDLNTIKVTESSPTLTGVTQTVTVGVGEYQIWRASDAYRSIFLGGTNVRLKIQDEQGIEIKSSISTF